MKEEFPMERTCKIWIPVYKYKGINLELWSVMPNTKDLNLFIIRIFA
jgi:hypothetical protein